MLVSHFPIPHLKQPCPWHHWGLYVVNHHLSASWCVPLSYPVRVIRGSQHNPICTKHHALLQSHQDSSRERGEQYNLQSRLKGNEEHESEENS